MAVPADNSVHTEAIGIAASGHGVTAVYQPIVSLPDGAPVGYEALSRWPGLDDPSPQTVFSHAGARGELDPLDRACTTAALAAALDSDAAAGTMLLVNCEPASRYVGRAEDSLLARAGDQFQLFFEFTERDLLGRPRALLDKVARIRADGFGIALDDVGASPDSAALLDVICPDVVKLDMNLVQEEPSDEQASALSAILAHQERTGSVVLAEGIETAVHLEQALALGADLGQGFMFGEALGPSSMGPTAPRVMQRQDGWDDELHGTPFDLVATRVPVRLARKHTLTALSRHIERQARSVMDPPLVLTVLQRAEYFNRATKRLYQQLAQLCPLVAVFGENVPADLGHGARGVALSASDPLADEWAVVGLGPHTAAALIAREHLPTREHSTEADRRFEMAITYDRGLVTQAARGLLARIP